MVQQDLAQFPAFSQTYIVAGQLSSCVWTAQLQSNPIGSIIPIEFSRFLNIHNGFWQAQTFIFRMNGELQSRASLVHFQDPICINLLVIQHSGWAQMHTLISSIRDPLHSNFCHFFLTMPWLQRQEIKYLPPQNHTGSHEWLSCFNP